jgi:hypothetical protein
VREICGGRETENEADGLRRKQERDMPTIQVIRAKSLVAKTTSKTATPSSAPSVRGSPPLTVRMTGVHIFGGRCYLRALPCINRRLGT